MISIIMPKCCKDSKNAINAMRSVVPFKLGDEILCSTCNRILNFRQTQNKKIFPVSINNVEPTTK
jgi:hypothetical protein